MPVSAGMTLLPDTQVIEAEGHQILILQVMAIPSARMIRTTSIIASVFTLPWIQRLFLWLPLSLRLKIAKKNARGQSVCQSAQKAEAIMDVNQNEVMKAFPSVPDPLDDHGRTHRPAVA